MSPKAKHSEDRICTRCPVHCCSNEKDPASNIRTAVKHINPDGEKQDSNYEKIEPVSELKSDESIPDKSSSSLQVLPSGEIGDPEKTQQELKGILSKSSSLIQSKNLEKASSTTIPKASEMYGPATFSIYVNDMNRPYQRREWNVLLEGLREWETTAKVTPPIYPDEEHAEKKRRRLNREILNAIKEDKTRIYKKKHFTVGRTGSRGFKPRQTKSKELKYMIGDTRMERWRAYDYFKRN